MDNITYVLGLIDAATLDYITNAFTNITNAIRPVFRNLLIIFFILYGLGIWKGIIKVDALIFIWDLIRIAVIYSFVFTFAFYNAVIVEFFTKSPDVLAATMIGAQSETVTGLIGSTYDLSLNAAANAFDKSGIVVPIVLGSIILFSSTILILFTVFLLGLSKIALAVLIGIGPLAFLMLIFKSTRKIFEAWLQQVINFFMITVLSIMVLSLSARIYQTAVNRIPNEPGLIELGTVIPILIIGFTIALILKQVPAIASGIAGGVQISTLGAEGRASAFVGRGVTSGATLLKGGRQGLENLSRRFNFRNRITRK